MKKFYNLYEHYTGEQWLALAIHENRDFSFSIKIYENKNELNEILTNQNLSGKIFPFLKGSKTYE